MGDLGGWGVFLWARYPCSAPEVGRSRSVAERKGINFTGLKDFCLQYGSSQGQNRVLTIVLCVPNSLESSEAGRPKVPETHGCGGYRAQEWVGWGVSVKDHGLWNHPQPSTLNPQPPTLNPQPSALNPKPSILNSKPSTLISNSLTPNPLSQELEAARGGAQQEGVQGQGREKMLDSLHSMPGGMR